MNFVGVDNTGFYFYKNQNSRLFFANNRQNHFFDVLKSKCYWLTVVFRVSGGDIGVERSPGVHSSLVRDEFYFITKRGGPEKKGENAKKSKFSLANTSLNGCT